MTTLAIPPAIVGRGAIRISLDRGIHPATLKPLLEPGTTEPTSRCGGCAFLVGRVAGDGTPRMKCKVKAQRRRGPDIKPDFPACVEFRTAAAA
ncbi:hypothetical protein [Streptomyces sp. RKAG337]|uniref:hypothetical protein n=1 Tax=Streptomyces sp. RKAG337 TaxID=2893404 RepID=UPI0020335CBC|nr:hypothetical protein [Streptomyces sp. RKAG337]MCM2430928.1 hypothetical protein [Streptomyces sp. RKAG337]